MHIKQRKSHRQKKNGNALFLILIVVVLFAALSFAVTRSTRSGGNLSQEQINLGVSRFLSYVSQVRVAATRLQANGIDPLAMDFSKPMLLTAEFLAGSTPTVRQVNSDCHGDQCAVFSPNGGGAIPILNFQEYAPADWATNSCSSMAIAAASGYVAPVIWAGAGSTLSDLALKFECFSATFCSALRTATRTNASSTTGGTQPIPTFGSPSQYSTFFLTNDTTNQRALPNALTDDPNGSGILQNGNSTYCTVYVLILNR